jgi:tetratricopeptide (TPR) repeat protein
MIVRNEEQFLPECLASVRGLVDDVVVVDTGSSDATVAVAEAAGARVFQHAWSDDFSEARNVSLDHAVGDWVLVLDADERLATGGADAVRAFLSSTEADCGLLRVQDATRLDAAEREVLSGAARKGDPTRAPRLFRRAEGLRFEGRIHEEVTSWLYARGMKVAFVDADLVHLGRVEEVAHAREKLARNVKLLEDWARSAPDDFSAQGFLACELLAADRLDECRQVVDAGWVRFLAEKAPPWRSALRLAVARCIVAASTGDVATVVDTTRRVTAREGRHPDLAFLLGQAHEVAALLGHGRARTLALGAAARAYEEALSLSNMDYAQRFVPGSSGKEALVRLGTVRLTAGEPGSARETFEAALKQDPADVDAALGLAEAQNRVGAPQAALAELERLLPLAFDAWILAADAAHELGSASDMVAVLDRAAGQRREYRAPHRKELHLDLLALRALYEGRPASVDGPVGRLVAVASRVPFGDEKTRPLDAKGTRLPALAKNLVKLRRFDALDAFFEPRAESLLPGCRAVVLKVLEAEGFQVEDTGTAEPTLLLATTAEDRDFFGRLLAEHPAFSASFPSAIEAARPGSAAGSRELFAAVAAPEEVRGWLEAFPASRVLMVGGFPSDLELPGAALEKCLTFGREDFLTAPVQALERTLAFLGEPSHPAPLRYLIESYPGARGSEATT